MLNKQADYSLVLLLFLMKTCLSTGVETAGISGYGPFLTKLH